MVLARDGVVGRGVAWLAWGGVVGVVGVALRVGEEEREYELERNGGFNYESN